ncbi:MAG: DNA/RNA nuclease SfsA [Candidatus Malihini olakiniferum]
MKLSWRNGYRIAGYSQITPEVTYDIENSRIDLLLQAYDWINFYIEMKSVKFLQQTPLYMSPHQGFFHDAVTQRGQKHLRELIKVAEKGERAVLFFTLLHSGIAEVAPVYHIDACYAELF